MTAVATKLPSDKRPLIQDPDLAAALEKTLAALTGKALERAQSAIVKVRWSGVQGSFSQVLAAYEKAIAEAVADK